MRIPDEPRPEIAPESGQEPPQDATPPRPDDSRCDLCGFPLAIERHCKIICPNCGFTRDCSDP